MCAQSMCVYRFGGYIVAGLHRRFLHLGDMSYCYYDRPATDPENATTVLFLHGFTSNKTMWMVVCKYLPKVSELALALL